MNEPHLSPAAISATLRELHEKYLPLREGRLADYIPELSKADPDHFGIAVATVKGEVFEAGNAEDPITLQSVSKPFVYGMALEDLGAEAVHEQVGMEPTGEAFNSIIELEKKTHRPYNPMINAGALAVTNLISGTSPADKLGRILRLFSRYAGHPVHLDGSVFVSERFSGHRNRAIAHLLRHFGRMGPEIDENLDLYFQQCSILFSTKDMALMAATLANGGVQPVTGERVLARPNLRPLLSLMFTCGMYDSSGEWAFHVGLPAKSGVSGGILAVVPGKMGIAVTSPLLDKSGHSVRGHAVFRELAERWGLSLFNGGGEA
jgi:glutaminase